MTSGIMAMARHRRWAGTAQTGITTVRNIIDRPAPAAVANWVSADPTKWTLTYAAGTISVNRQATADALTTCYLWNTGLQNTSSPVLTAGTQWQRSLEVLSTVQVTVVAIGTPTGAYPTGQVIPANVWTTIRNNFIASGSAAYVTSFKLQADSDPGLGVLTQLRHAMLVEDKSVWRTNQAINPGYEGTAFTSIVSVSGTSYAPSTDTIAPINGTKSALFTRVGTLTNTIGAIIGTPNTTATKMPVTEGQPVTGGMSIKTDVANNAYIYTRWYWYDAGSVLTAGAATTRVMNMVAGQVYRAVETGTPPPGTVGAWFLVTVANNSGTVGGEKVWADLLTLEYGTTDGSWFGSTGSFTGTVDASTSVVATQQIAYADGTYPNWAWEGSPNSSPSFGPVSYVPIRTNLATNGDYESGTNSFQTGNGSVYVQSVDTVTPIGGTRSALFTRSGSLSSFLAQINFVSSTIGNRIAVTEGQPITGAVSIKTDAANTQIITRWYWYDAVATLTQGTQVVKITGMTANQVYRVADTNTPPPGTVTAIFSVDVKTSGGNVVGGEKVWADYLTLEYGTTDGSWF